MSIAYLRKKYGISNEWIAEKLGYKSTKTYTNSPYKPKVENLMKAFHERIKERL